MKNGFPLLTAVALITLLLVALTFAAGGQAGSSPALGAAMDKEKLGDLKGAIEAYREIANGKDRAMAAVVHRDGSFRSFVPFRPARITNVGVGPDTYSVKSVSYGGVLLDSGVVRVLSPDAELLINLK